ncbi:hypothetical protein SDC9_96939 [bioreactor metagenome]|uniref:Uncharacterized protein n=1 Tax=bioreactor metagenome TaxID=1076179 RepID=A0A645AH71_9ZZZZ
MRLAFDLDLLEVETTVEHGFGGFSARQVQRRDQHVGHLDVQEFLLRATGLASRDFHGTDVFTGCALLHQRGKALVKTTTDGQVLPLSLTGAAAAAVCKSTSIGHATSDGLDVQPALVLGIFSFALNAVDLAIDIDHATDALLRGYIGHRVVQTIYCHFLPPKKQGLMINSTDKWGSLRNCLLHRWQLGHQSQGNRQALELVVRPQKELGCVIAWVLFDFLNHNLSRSQGFHCLNGLG